jgi:hypothetical protein
MIGAEGDGTPDEVDGARALRYESRKDDADREEDHRRQPEEAMADHNEADGQARGSAASQPVTLFVAAQLRPPQLTRW